MKTNKSYTIGNEERVVESNSIIDSTHAMFSNTKMKISLLKSSLLEVPKAFQKVILEEARPALPPRKLGRTLVLVLTTGVFLEAALPV